MYIPQVYVTCNACMDACIQILCVFIVSILLQAWHRIVKCMHYVYSNNRHVTVQQDLNRHVTVINSTIQISCNRLKNSIQMPKN